MSFEHSVCTSTANDEYHHELVVFTLHQRLVLHRITRCLVDLADVGSLMLCDKKMCELIDCDDFWRHRANRTARQPKKRRKNKKWRASHKEYCLHVHRQINRQIFNVNSRKEMLVNAIGAALRDFVIDSLRTVARVESRCEHNQLVWRAQVDEFHRTTFGVLCRNCRLSCTIQASAVTHKLRIAHAIGPTVYEDLYRTRGYFVPRLVYVGRALVRPAHSFLYVYLNEIKNCGVRLLVAEEYGFSRMQHESGNQHQLYANEIIEWTGGLLL